MSHETRLFISRSQRRCFSTTDASVGRIEKLRTAYPDIEVVTESEWKQYIESELISTKASVSNEMSFLNGMKILPSVRHAAFQDLEFCIAGNPLGDNIYSIYCRYQDAYYFLHDRSDVSPQQLIVKIQLCIDSLKPTSREKEIIVSN
jgi:hypothetical protein